MSDRERALYARKFKCPNCQHRATLDEHDVAGADDGNIFCRQCCCEFNPATMKAKPDSEEIREELKEARQTQRSLFA